MNLIGISNLIKWTPTIWNDRYWDSYYLFKIMRKKLMLMEKHFRANGIHEDAILDADNMMICIKCIDRLIADDYHDIAFKEHDEKWGKLEIIFGKKGNSRIYFSRPNAITEEQIQQETDESKKLWEKSNEMKQHDLTILFETMRENVLKWWD
jgi:hypothetical protein